MEIDKIYVIIKDKDGNFHQAVMDEGKTYIVGGLVECYPNNNFTKDCVKDLSKLNFSKVI